MELRFLEPARETRIGSRNREVRNIGGKITLKQVQGKQLLVQVIRGFEKSGSTVLLAYHALCEVVRILSNDVIDAISCTAY